MKVDMYKKGQGELARWIAGALIALVFVQGAVSLSTVLLGFVDIENPSAWGNFFAKDIAVLPLINWQITVASIVSFLIFLFICYLVFRFLVNGRRSSNFLIETESELRKVSWPSRREYLNSSVVVIISVIVLGVFLVVADKAVLKLMHFLGIYG